MPLCYTDDYSTPEGKRHKKGSEPNSPPGRLLGTWTDLLTSVHPAQRRGLALVELAASWGLG